MSGVGWSRRAALRSAGVAVLAGAGLLGGCDVDLGSSATTGATPRPYPDQHVVDAARAELRGLLRRLAATPGAGDLVACHRRQLAALQGSPPRSDRGARALPRPQLVVHEQRAAMRFRTWALECSDGDLARLLASIAAGISMQPVPRGVR